MRTGDKYKKTSFSGVEEGHILNFIQGVEIKMTKDMGRGVFASQDLKKG
jgi:hypothetical protein